MSTLGLLGQDQTSSNLNYLTALGKNLSGGPLPSFVRVGKVCDRVQLCLSGNDFGILLSV